MADRLLATATGSEFVGRVVKKDKTEYVYRLASAEQNFRRRLRAVLPRRAQLVGAQPGIGPEELPA